MKPQIVVEVAFGEWTPDGNVRHPVFKGVRADKPANGSTRERARDRRRRLSQPHARRR